MYCVLCTMYYVADLLDVKAQVKVVSLRIEAL